MRLVFRFTDLLKLTLHLKVWLVIDVEFGVSWVPLGVLHVLKLLHLLLALVELCPGVRVSGGGELSCVLREVELVLEHVHLTTPFAFVLEPCTGGTLD